MSRRNRSEGVRTHVATYVDEEVNKWLIDTAQKHKLTVSRLVHEIIDWYIEADKESRRGTIND